MLDSQLASEPTGRLHTHQTMAMRMEPRRFHVLVGAVVLLYLLIETAYVLRLPLVMDEFQDAATVAAFEGGLPYRDFAPYKTVLGYYLHLPPYLIGSDTWSKLMAVKLATALLNAACLGVTALVLARWYAREAVWAGLILTVLMSTFLERSSEFRVDMLTSWAGLASLLLLLSGRSGWAGVAAGLSFLVSQKGIYYALAGGIALVGSRIFGHTRSEVSVWRFSVAAIVTVAAYVAFWSLWADSGLVLRTMFWTPRWVAVQDIYDNRLYFWMQTIARNPVFWGFAALGLIRLFGPPLGGPSRPREWTLVLYALTVAGLSAWHKQPWPYFFVLVIPTAFVLIVALIDANRRERGYWCPLGRTRLAFGVCFAFGVLFPLTRLPVNLSRDSGFQRHTIKLAEHILAPQETYLAGMDMLYGRRQPVGALRWLDARRIGMLRSMPPEAVAAVVDSLEHARLKLVIQNYRLASLPPTLEEYIDSEMTPLSGNILIYGPRVGAGKETIDLKFTGQYQLDAPASTRLFIDGRSMSAGATTRLQQGRHSIESSNDARLKLLPDGWDALAAPRYREAEDFFPQMYSY